MSYMRKELTDFCLIWEKLRKKKYYSDVDNTRLVEEFQILKKNPCVRNLNVISYITNCK